MNNKEYRDNQKVQRKAFKKYRKHMIKVLVGFLFAMASAFIFPEYVFPLLNSALKGILSEYLAGSITVWTQILCVAGGVLSGVVNAFKAVSAKENIDKAQDLEEDIVDSLVNQNDELAKKVADLEKEKVKVEEKKESKSNNYRKSSNSYTLEEENVKKLTK